MTPLSQPMATAGRWEPSMTATLLLGCKSCGAPHPLALRPPLQRDSCQVCDAPVAAAGRTVTVDAKTGLWLWAANTLHGWAKALIKLSERL